MSKDEKNSNGHAVNGHGSTDWGSDWPSPVQELAAACVRFVATKYKVALDFSPDTLSLVDQYVHDARTEGITAETLPVVEGAAGAYLGEVIRRAHGGIWDAEGDPETWRVLMTHVYLGVNPVAMMREALTLEHDPRAALEAEPAEQEALEARLAALGEVDEEEFFSPTTRFDVVEIAVEALAAKAREAGLGDVRFTKEDYD
ncbi:MAG TPA: hypothetical protein VF407_06700 [Polyangiaceae bacterium]